MYSTKFLIILRLNQNLMRSEYSKKKEIKLRATTPRQCPFSHLSSTKTQFDGSSFSSRTASRYISDSEPCEQSKEYYKIDQTLFGSYRRRKRERKLKYTRESEKGKSGAVGRRHMLERDDAHEKSPKKAAPATHFCADTLVDNAQQRSEALSMSTTLATTLKVRSPCR